MVFEGASLMIGRAPMVLQGVVRREKNEARGFPHKRTANQKGGEFYLETGEPPNMGGVFRMKQTRGQGFSFKLGEAQNRGMCLRACAFWGVSLALRLWGLPPRLACVFRSNRTGHW